MKQKYASAATSRLSHMWPENTADADIEANFLPKSKVGQMDTEKQSTVSDDTSLIVGHLQPVFLDTHEFFCTERRRLTIIS